MGEKRARDLGVSVGNLRAGPNNAITDVEGVRVGHSTIIRGEGPLVVGEGPVRTGVTVVCPREGFTRENPVFAGSHRFNGNGEMTGLEWIRGFTCTKELLARLGSASAERALGRLQETLAAHASTDGVWFDSRAWIVKARRP